MPKIYILFILLIVLIAGLFITATSPPVQKDPYTGLYYVHGSKMIEFSDCPFIEICGPDEGPFVDTTYFSSVVAVKMMQEKADTLHFFGLPGADESENKFYFGNYLRSDGAPFLPAYDTSVRDRVYGSYSGTAFKIDYNLISNFYKATGTINNGIIEIQGLYTDRAISVEFDLMGEKIYTVFK
ncbi:MAG: hypothetical protein JJU37_06620 [Balneolaceae bacterium]|nr:hypothetical protein [Balneolaceae bacterium]